MLDASGSVEEICYIFWQLNRFQTLSTFVDFHLLGVEGSIPDQEVQSLQLNFSGKQCSSMKFEISTDMYHT